MIIFWVNKLRMEFSVAVYILSAATVFFFIFPKIMLDKPQYL